MLDVGCGSTRHRTVCKSAGFHYVGLDFDREQADMLGDCQALPFADDSFEFALSIQVGEHVPYPYLMMQEVFRVLKPGARFLGSVAFLEPFHDSFFHPTHWGLSQMLEVAGFEIQCIGATPGYHGLRAQATMALLPGLPRVLTSLAVAPLFGMHCLYYRVGAVVKRVRREQVSTSEQRI